MSENLKAFLELAKVDSELQDRLTKMTKEGLIAVAKEKGIELSEEDFRAPAGEMDEAELGNVGGGSGLALCAFVGGGGGTNECGNVYGCGCALYGQGGDAKESHWNCTCAILGGGDEIDHGPFFIR